MSKPYIQPLTPLLVVTCSFDSIKSSLNTRLEIIEAFEDTKNQRRIIKNRLDSTSFSPETFVNAGIEEINLFNQALDIEINIIQGYFSFLHQNQKLTNHIRISP